MIVLVGSKQAGLLPSVHRADNRTSGAILFPVGLLLCAGLYWDISPLIFQGSALILGLADGLAGIIGQKIGKRPYRITGHKTIEGSLIFFIITFFLMLSILLLSAQHSINPARLLGITIAALLLTATEGALSKGWDNVPVPLLGGLALYYLL